MDSTSDCKHTGGAGAVIAREIEAAPGRVISFARFMELALYHPEHGYYNRSENIIGKSGDFFTSVSVGSLFGEMLAFWLKKQGVRRVVEAGAHDGKLAADILGVWDVDYTIVEPSAHLRELQEERLAAFSKVAWVSGIEELGEIEGAIVCNELLDAFPVEVYRWQKAENEWQEFGVGIENSHFVWKRVPMTKKFEIEELEELTPHLPDQYVIEFNRNGEAWWSEAAKRLKSGLMLAIDYGDVAERLFTPDRTNGTLRVYRAHRLSNDILEAPGEQDITASVNFTAMQWVGEAQCLESDPLLTQGAFLSQFAAEFFASPPNAKQARQFQTLTHPEHLGRAFKVLVQRRV